MPKIEVPRIKESTLLIFLGMVSGVAFMDLKGFLIGPTVLILFRDLVLQIYREST